MLSLDNTVLVVGIEAHICVYQTALRRSGLAFLTRIKHLPEGCPYSFVSGHFIEFHFSRGQL